MHSKDSSQKEAPSKDPSNVKTVELYSVWNYGINDHFDPVTQLPSGFKPTGSLCADFRSLCQRLGVNPHPAIKAKMKSPPVATMRRPSVFNTAKAPETSPSPQVEVPLLHARSTLFDKISIQLLSLLLPTTTNIKGICFSDCRLDTEMLRALRQGLTWPTSVESLQVEWNPFDLPLPAEESPVPSTDDAAPSSDVAAVQDDGLLGTRGLEERERRRYWLQSQRTLRTFRDWMESQNDGSLEPAWRTLATNGVDFQAALSSDAFLELVGTQLGLSGAHVMEVFDVLDGPDYAGSQGSISVSLLKSALEGLPEEAPGDDLTGVELACLLEPSCALEALSFRSCSLTRLEIGPIAVALAAKPWQLRCLNLWENRICDRGAEALATAFESYRGLEYIGLGRNRITDVGLKLLCKPFEYQILSEDQVKDATALIKDQQLQLDAMAKAKAKYISNKSRPTRQAVIHLNELEERSPASDGAEATYLLRRPSELKSLVLSENPIRNADIVEALHPRGPRSAELVLRGCPAAAIVTARRPDLQPKLLRNLLTAQKDEKQTLEGWQLRLF